jgi:putative component of toxin-antitoxin plasmid stabilization module
MEVVLTEWYHRDLELLPRLEKMRVERKVVSLSSKPWSAAIADRTIAPLMDGIYEVRILGRGAAYRVLFFVAPGRSPRLVVVTTCAAKAVMKKRAGMNAEVARAKARRQAWLAEQEKADEG